MAVKWGLVDSGGTARGVGDRSDSGPSTTTNGGEHTHNVITNQSTTGGSTANTTATGIGTPINNLPPYKSVYIWERTA